MPTSPEVPEADALEQDQPVVNDGPTEAVSLAPPTAFEIPEADALDQAREVGLGDDDWR
jgi:hypothetical protein